MVGVRAVDEVAVGPAAEGVDARAAGEVVRPGAALQRVRAVAAVEHIVVGAAGQAIVAVPAEQRVATAAAVERVGSRAGLEAVFAVATTRGHADRPGGAEGVVAGAALEHDRVEVGRGAAGGLGPAGRRARWRVDDVAVARGDHELGVAGGDVDHGGGVHRHAQYAVRGHAARGHGDRGRPARRGRRQHRERGQEGCRPDEHAPIEPPARGPAIGRSPDPRAPERPIFT
jgi:hypothetical protein